MLQWNLRDGRGRCFFFCFKSSAPGAGPMPAARVGVRGNGAGASVRPLLDCKGRSPRTGKQHGGKENRKTAHERDRGGYQELSQAIEPDADGEVLSLVQRF